MLVRHIRDLLKRRDVELRVSDTLDVYGLGLLVDRSVECGRIIRSDELDMDTVLLQQDLELVVRAAVEVRRRNDVVAGLCESGDRLVRLIRSNRLGAPKS